SSGFGNTAISGGDRKNSPLSGTLSQKGGNSAERTYFVGVSQIHHRFIRFLSQLFHRIFKEQLQKICSQGGCCRVPPISVSPGDIFLCRKGGEICDRSKQSGQAIWRSYGS